MLDSLFNFVKQYIHITKEEMSAGTKEMSAGTKEVSPLLDSCNKIANTNATEFEEFWQTFAETIFQNIVNKSFNIYHNLIALIYITVQCKLDLIEQLETQQVNHSNVYYLNCILQMPELDSYFPIHLSSEDDYILVHPGQLCKDILDASLPIGPELQKLSYDTISLLLTQIEKAI